MKKKTTLVVVFALACAGVMIASGCKSSKQEASELVSEIMQQAGVEKKSTSEKPLPGGANVNGELDYPALPIRDAFGEDVYIPPVYDAAAVYAAIKKVEPYCDSDHERDKMVLFIIWKNQPFIKDTAFAQVRDDYLLNYDDANVHEDWEAYCEEFRSGTNKVPPELLLIDEKESEVFGEIMRVYRESGDYDTLLSYYSDYAFYLVDNWEELTPLYAMLESLVKGNYKYEGWLAGVDQQGKGLEIRELGRPFRDTDFLVGNMDCEEPYVSSHK
jgi:hypothetical protein